MASRGSSAARREPPRREPQRRPAQQRRKPVQSKSQRRPPRQQSVVIPFPAPQPRPKLRILLAEDNDINREIETELLERIGFVVDPAADGLAAWEKAQKASPGDYDLVILDLQMPLMDGWEVAAAIRGLPDPTMARIPIVALSANSQLDDQRRTLESGFDTHLPKPLDLNVLLETIGQLTKKPLS